MTYVMDKKQVVVIAPLPPPLNGNTIAFNTFINNEKVKNSINNTIIDLSKQYKSTFGVLGKKFSVSAMMGVIKTAFRIKKTSKDLKIDYFYYSIANSYYGFIRDCIYLWAMKKKDGAKIVVHLHGGALKFTFAQLPILYKWVVKKGYKRIDTAIVLSEGLRDMFSGLVAEDRIVCIPNCVDNECLLSEDEYKNKISRFEDKKKITILYMSNISKEKGYIDVIKAVIKCIELGIDVELIFAGAFIPNDEEQHFRKIIGIENKRIKYMGIVSGAEKLKLYARADIFILPSRLQEGMPLSILEAMGNGLGVITTWYPGIADLVEHNENALIVNKNNPQEITDAIQKLCNDRRLLKSMSLINRKKIMSQYNEDKYINSLIEVFS